MAFSLQSLYDWYRDVIRNPKYRWWIILGTIAYIVMPFDIAPDFIPIIGQIDDAIIITLLFTEVSQLLIERVKNKKEVVDSEQVASGDTPVDVQAVSID
ncbi:YkvA family protein [Thermoleptolyngbya sichuanensis XZ-Cy5]|uniref:YkvA family protein n=1 Tax=Thermoleptolyngbya sichuanensis TaxID=2885951 RepID=UPI00240E1D5C|nr:YkvA family protein [Thermoleptolyngbya sichuanensis]MDG2617003.1 YkvA family protein [Thermoleptolyngbya sichuanensis XZ-Cy5]